MPLKINIEWVDNPLKNAVVDNNPTALATALEKNSSAFEVRAALEEAIERNRLGCVETLIPFTDAASLGGWALISASGYGFAPIVKRLAAFADQEHLRLALGQAIVAGHSECVEELIAVTECAYDDSYALQLAAGRVKYDGWGIFEMLFDVSVPQDALNALRGRRPQHAQEALEHHMSLKTRQILSQEITGNHPTKTRKM